MQLHRQIITIKAYIKGGSQKLSECLAEVITENNGSIKINADVQKILLNQNKTKAIGVVYKDKKSAQDITLYANNIIANCDPRITYSQRLDGQIKEKYTKHDFTADTSLLSIYMVFDTNLSEKFPDMDYSTFCVNSQWFHAELSPQTENLLNMPIEERGFVFVSYSKIDSGLSQKDNRFFWRDYCFKQL